MAQSMDQFIRDEDVSVLIFCIDEIVHISLKVLVVMFMEDIGIFSDSVYQSIR